MKLRAALWLFMPACALAQLQVFVLAGGMERPAGAIVDLGAVDASDTLDTRFRARNPGGASLVMHTLAVAGTGFSLPSRPALPVTIPAGGALEFTVRFEPRAPGAYSAVLTVNTATFILRSSAEAAVVLWLEADGQRLKLSSGATVDFGAVQRGSASSRRFVLENPTTAALGVSELTVSGTAFRGPLGLGLPLELGPQRAEGFQVVFEPGTVGQQEGRLTLSGRAFRLTGQGVEPPLPAPLIVLDPPAPRSGQQVRLTIRLDAAARTAGQGELRLRFEPATAGVPDDPAIGFLSPAGRVVAFSVEPGATTARFAGRAEIEMQTGTTAGRLILNAQLGTNRAEAVVTLAAQPVAVDSVRALRSAGALEVNLTGFDNTRSASQLAFTFYDREARPMGSGAIVVDAAAEFRRYFEGSALGGVFALRAVFPVSGDAARISGVEVELRNGMGTTRPPRASF